MIKPEKETEDSTYAYLRPKDAATLILIDRSAGAPKVLVGKRHDKVVFQPGKFVFPGGRVDATDNRIPVAAEIPKALEAKLVSGSPKITPARARALAVAAIREACEETGLCLGRPIGSAGGVDTRLTGEWRPFADAGLLPDPSGLFFIARAITPPGRVRRFDTRFFTADISAIAHRVEGVVHADAELVELVWVELGSSSLDGLHAMTKNVLRELSHRLGQGPLSHAAEVPFYHQTNGDWRRDMI